MSELIDTNDNRATIRWKLLTGVSALALTAYVSSANVANAADADRPLIWIELSGQMEQIEGLSSTFKAPFMSLTPDADTYSDGIFSRNQKPPRFSFGMDGKISFQPEDSDWIFSAAIEYGRAHTDEHEHQQGAAAYAPKYNRNTHTTKQFPLYAAAFGDAQTRNDEQHTILDFSAGKDVGIGKFGPNGESVISAGVRFAQFSDKSATANSARPHIGYITRPVGFFNWPYLTFYQFNMTGHAERSFKGAGPSLAWEASAALAGNAQDGELSLDWGINGALLFGRQKAKVDHSTQEHHLSRSQCYYSSYTPGYCYGFYKSSYPQIYQHQHRSVRSKSVMVSNVGGFVALTARYKAAKVSLGYRYDTFLKAMDTGIDAAKKSNLTFNGPYASISIGLGD